MEKPVTVDAPTTRRMIALADEADQKNLKVGVGLMIRHCEGRRQLHERIRDGQIGELMLMRAYRMGGRAAAAGPAAGRRKRIALPGPPVPQFPVGQRRPFQRLQHPPDRRVLLDEERLARPRPAPPADAISAAMPSTRTSTVTRSNTLRGRHEVVLHRPQPGRLSRRIRQLRPRHHRFSHRLHRRPYPGQASGLSKARTSRGRT
jgi:hypothetical protein